MIDSSIFFQTCPFHNYIYIYFFHIHNSIIFHIWFLGMKEFGLNIFFLYICFFTKQISKLRVLQHLYCFPITMSILFIFDILFVGFRKKYLSPLNPLEHLHLYIYCVYFQPTLISQFSFYNGYVTIIELICRRYFNYL